MENRADAETGRATPSPLRRLAAAGALITLLAVFAVVVAGLVQNPVRLVAAVLLVLVAAVAGWTALVHRGGPRTAAAVVAVVSLVAIVLLLDFGSVVRLATVLGLVLVSSAAARVAIGRDLVPTPVQVRARPPRAVRQPDISGASLG